MKNLVKDGLIAEVHLGDQLDLQISHPVIFSFGDMSKTVCLKIKIDPGFISKIAYSIILSLAVCNENYFSKKINSL